MSNEVRTGWDGRPPKTVLICPTCGHESPLTGDWRIEADAADTVGATQAYVCPACETTVTRRL
jgi:predicted RNA-binding Zn-ribbon protein involved in translation (DUF1610 family)